ncbi:MAG: WecB/TagA/CpsF family glycosyltransferase [Anaerolineae bacterium]|nr:WecB/TagA/CpsF family glycosyltransferase [Anaerolineae bacterium]
MFTPSERAEGAAISRPRQNAASVTILGVRVHALTWEAFEAQAADFVRSGQAHQVVTINPEFIMAAQHDPAFARVLAAADLALADGWGLLWAARRFGKPLPTRITGSDGVPRLAALAAREGWRVFLLGAGPGIAEQAANVLCARHPALQIVGCFGGSPRPDEEEAIVARITAARPHVLFVAYGAPNQDLWIARTQPRLQIPLAMGVGGSLDFIAGVRRRAPAWLQRLHLEWLFRLAQEPRRWRRQLALPRFVWAVLRA